MKNLLITGGTVFVSRYAAEYFAAKGYNVYTLNRNTRPQPKGTTLIEADRRALGDKLRGYHFDAVLDITSYTGEDVKLLLDALGSYGEYILMSSSAVYPDDSAQPFTEKAPVGLNKIWGAYGSNKIDAENALLKRKPDAYILRPAYIYGQMNNIYREAFVFECALGGRKFYLPKDGGMKMQFFHVDDLCRFMEIILENKPEQHVFNIGNRETVSIREWVSLCYRVAGKQPEFVNVPAGIEQRDYFSFHDYEYCLDISEQEKLLPETKPMEEGLKEAYAWYLENPDSVTKRPLIEFIDGNLK